MTGGGAWELVRGRGCHGRWGFSFERGRGGTTRAASTLARHYKSVAVSSEQGIPRAPSALCAVIIAKRDSTRKYVVGNGGHDILITERWLFSNLQPRKLQRTTPTSSPPIIFVWFLFRLPRRQRNLGIRVHWIIQRNCQSINKTDGIVSIHTRKLQYLECFCSFKMLRSRSAVRILSITRTCWAGPLMKMLQFFPYSCFGMRHCMTSSSCLIKYDITVQPVFIGNK